MMQEGTRTTGAARLLWPLVLGLGLALGLLWGLMPHPAAEAQAVNPGFTVDLAYNAVWGLVNPGDSVTVTRATGGAAYGAAEADGVGFFWTPLWQSNGQPADVRGGDTIAVYVNGALATTLSPQDISGQIDVLDDKVVGTISGDTGGTPVTVTMGIWAHQMSFVGTPQVTALTDGSGTFNATFTGNLAPHNYVRVEYAGSPGTVQDYLYPHEVFHVDTLQWLFGYATPGKPVTMTVYVNQTSNVRWSKTTTATRLHGDYSGATTVAVGDLVEVDLGGGTVITTVAWGLTAYPDATLDRVTGTCPPNETVHVGAWNWRLGTYAETFTTADSSGNYTATFTGYDLKASDSVYPAFADEEGDEVLLSTAPPRIIAFPEGDRIEGSADAPNVPYTATLYHAPGTYVQTGTTRPGFNSIGSNDFGGVDVAPGDVVTVETATWSGVMTVADLSFDFDTAGDRVLGDADIPGWVSAWVQQWMGWQYPVHSQAAVSSTVTSPFIAAFTGFDLRDGCYACIEHYDDNDFATRVEQDVRYFQVNPPNGVSAPQFSGSDVLTATLYESDGVTVKRQTSEDRDGNPEWYWMDMEGDIATGDWVTVTDDAGWVAGLQVPTLTVQADEDTDLVWGEGPKSLLFIEHASGDWSNWHGLFVPVDGYALDLAFFDRDIQRGDNVVAIYQAPSGNHVRREFRWPQARVNYGHNWVGADYPAGHTFWITVTDSGGTAKATATMSTVPGGGWGADGFQTDWDDWSPDQPDIEPGDWAYFQADDGYSNAIHVGTITGAVDVDNDSVGGNVYATWFTQTLDIECHAWGAPGGAPTKDSTAAPDGSVPYFCQWDPMTEWDILPGQDVAVMYLEPDGDRVINVFEEPAPDLRVGKWSDGQPAAGSNFAYWIEYENDGDVDATDAVLTDTLPLGTSYVADSSGFPANVNGRAITWSLGTVPADSEARFLLVVAVDSGASGTLHNEAQIDTLYDGDPWNNSAASDDDVQPVDVDLEVDKRNESDQPAPGYDFTYRVEYRNHGSTDSGVVTLTDTLPLSTTFVSWHAYDPLWNLVGVVGNQAVFTRPVIPGDSGDELYLTLHLSDTVREGTTLTNEVEIATTNETGDLGDNTHTHTMDVQHPRLEIGVDKEFNEGTTVADHDITYRIHYRNHGNVPAYGVAITDTLPSGTTFVTSTVEVWQNGDWRDVPFPPTHTTSSQVVWDVGTLDPGEDHDLRVTLHINPGVAAGTVLTNAADIAPTLIVTFTDDYLPNNHAEASVAVRAPGPNLMIVKRADWRGGPPWQLEYHFDYYNVGTTRIDSFTITDTYPLSTTFNQGDVWWGDPITFTNNYTDNQAIWQVGDSIRPGDSGGGRMTVDVDPAVGRGRIFTNVIELTIPPGDVHPADNTYVDVQTTGPDLYVVKTGPALWEEPGEVLTFTLRYGNQARRGEDRTDWSGTVYVTDTLPVGMAYVTSTQITPAIVGDRLVFDVGPQGDGWWNEIYLTVRITDTVQPGHVFTNSAAIASSNPTLDVEPYYDNNVDTATVNPSCIPLRSVDFGYAPLKPVIQSPVVFTATYLPLDATLPITYAWNFGDGGTGTGATTSHTYTVSGTLTVRVTAYNPCTPPGVSATPKDIEVAPLRIFLPVVMRNA